MPQKRSLPSERNGITFTELAIVLAIVGLLSYFGFMAVREARKNACRAQAEATLSYVYRMQMLHCTVHGRYSNNLEALRAVGLPEDLGAFYRFQLVSKNENEFVCLAYANLDFDPEADSLLVDQTGFVKHLAKD
jgi:Tfp pilus assembly protein PilE